MANNQPSSDGVRWIRVLSQADDDLPGNCLLKVTGITQDEDGFDLPTVNVPGEDGQVAGILVNGPTAIPAGKEGQAHATFPCAVLYDQGQGVEPAEGDIWGVKAGSMKLSPNRSGFRILAVPDTEDEDTAELVLVQPTEKDWEEETPDAFTEDQNDWEPLGPFDGPLIERISASTPIAITGIVAPDGIHENYPLILWNVGTHNIYLLRLSGSSSPGNKLEFSQDTDTLRVPLPSINGSVSSGSPIVTGIADTTGISAGDEVDGEDIPSGTTVFSVDSGTQITLSQNATKNNATERVSIFHFVDGEVLYPKQWALCLYDYNPPAIYPPSPRDDSTLWRISGFWDASFAQRGVINQQAQSLGQDIKRVHALGFTENYGTFGGTITTEQFLPILVEASGNFLEAGGAFPSFFVSYSQSAGKGAGIADVNFNADRVHIFSVVCGSGIGGGPPGTTATYNLGNELQPDPVDGITVVVNMGAKTGLGSTTQVNISGDYATLNVDSSPGGGSGLIVLQTDSTSNAILSVTATVDAKIECNGGSMATGYYCNGSQGQTGTINPLLATATGGIVTNLGVAGATGSFTSADTPPKTVTVSNGIILTIV